MRATNTDATPTVRTRAWQSAANGRKGGTVAGPVLPPSRFSAGHTVGGPTPSAPTPPPPRNQWRTPYAAATDLPISGAFSAAVSSPSQSAAAAGQVNPLARIAFVLVFAFGSLTAPATLPMALAARRQIQRNGQPGAGLANAAALVSIAYLTLGLVVGALWFYVNYPAPSGTR